MIAQSHENGVNALSGQINKRARVFRAVSGLKMSIL